jgi:hypothetical protein
MTKFHRHSAELGNLIRFQTVYIWEDKEAVGPAVWKILSPHTESLRDIVHTEVRQVPKVDAPPVNGVADPSSTLLLYKRTLEKRDRKIVLDGIIIVVAVRTPAKGNRNFRPPGHTDHFHSVDGVGWSWKGLTIH